MGEGGQSVNDLFAPKHDSKQVHKSAKPVDKAMKNAMQMQQQLLESAKETARSAALQEQQSAQSVSDLFAPKTRKYKPKRAPVQDKATKKAMQMQQQLLKQQKESAKVKARSAAMLQEASQSVNDLF